MAMWRVAAPITVAVSSRHCGDWERKGPVASPVNTAAIASSNSLPPWIEAK